MTGAERPGGGAARLRARRSAEGVRARRRAGAGRAAHADRQERVPGPRSSGALPRLREVGAPRERAHAHRRLRRHGVYRRRERPARARRCCCARRTCCWRRRRARSPAARRRNLGSYPLDRVVADPARIARGRRHAGLGAQPARRRRRRRASVAGARGARAAAADGCAPGRDDQHGEGRRGRAPPAVGRRDRLLHGHAQRHQGAAAARVRRRRDPVRRRPHQSERHRFVDAVPARARPTSTSTSTARKSAATTRRCGWSATRS